MKKWKLIEYKNQRKIDLVSHFIWYLFDYITSLSSDDHKAKLYFPFLRSLIHLLIKLLDYGSFLFKEIENNVYLSFHLVLNWIDRNTTLKRNSIAKNYLNIIKTYLIICWKMFTKHPYWFSWFKLVFLKWIGLCH